MTKPPDELLNDAGFLEHLDGALELGAVVLDLKLCCFFCFIQLGSILCKFTSIVDSMSSYLTLERLPGGRIQHLAGS